MFIYKGQIIQTHDLLEINPECFLHGVAAQGDRVPDWAEEHVRAVPYGVIRRGLFGKECLPIGVRGLQRNKRWATSCSFDAIRNVIRPAQLLGGISSPSRVKEFSAFRSLELLRARWSDLNEPWGPGGSVGFELATGRKVVKAGSDLDIVIRAAKPITYERAKILCAQTMDLPAVVDIRVETPVAGFCLKEYAQKDRAKILLRTPEGTVLGRDPWCKYQTS